mgnify:CR=1 FL=1
MSGFVEVRLDRTAGFSLDVKFTVPDDGVTALFGPSGCGKTTVLRSVAGLEHAEGRVEMTGHVWQDDEKKIFVPTYARRLGYVFQEASLFDHLSIRQNLEYGMKRIKDADAGERLNEAVELLGIGHLLTRRTSELSGGERQRVAIARALATNPRYLLCDEATSALDPNTTRSILELLREINKSLGVTIIVITHEMKVIDQICDRVAVIDKSCIAEEGRVADVFTNPKSDIARELVLPQERPVLDPTTGGRKLRLIFNGEDTQKPVISEMILACRVPVNVLFADTKSVEGAAYGHMILELPNDEHDAEKVVSWLKNSGLTWKEER